MSLPSIKSLVNDCKIACRRMRARILGRGWRHAVFVVLVIQGIALAVSAALHSPTVDEPTHLAAGLRYWTTGAFDLNRGNPPLVDLWASIPTVLANPVTEWSSYPSSFWCGRHLMNGNGSRAMWYIIWGRWMLLPVSALGGWLCAKWARDIYGRAAGLLALLLWSSCPLVMANGELITGDLSSTVAAMATMYAGWLWMREPTWKRALALGAILGIAQLTKFVCVVLYPSLALCWLLLRLCRCPPRIKSTRWLEACQLMAAVVLSVYVINWGYLFDGTCRPLGDLGISKKWLTLERSGQLRTEDPGQVPLWMQVPVPLPSNYLGGIDEISIEFDRLQQTYFHGAWIPGGVWHYYLSGLLWKLPVPLLVLFAGAVIGSCLNQRLRRKWTSEIVLLTPCVLFFIFVSYVTTIKYLRYILPVLPYLIIFASKTAWCYTKGGAMMVLIVSALAGWTVGATVAIYPHHASYFNEIAGGPENGEKYLVESSIDWGQDLYFLKDWIKHHPEAQPFYLAYFGGCDPQSIGISYQMPPINIKTREVKLSPGFYAISKSLLQGYNWPAVPNGKGQYVHVLTGELEYFRLMPVVGRAGHSMLIFRLSPELATRVNQQLSLHP